ncbi:MAG: hypothetical protein PHD97_00540 [Bacteroidales bacterium]|nr:hypothetical protein [Bacteroidales bacterium]
MAIPEKATIDKFEEIYPLLKEFQPSISKERWMNLFSYSFSGNENYCGYYLKEGNEIAGFLGLVFSKRIINGKEENICNTSTWVVKEKYRDRSLELLYPVLELENHTIVCHTPNSRVNEIYKKLNFKNLETRTRILLPIFNPFAKKELRFFYGNEIENEIADDKNLSKILNEHKKYNCFYLFLKTDEGKCLIVYTKVKRKKLPCTNIHFISNPELFVKYLSQIKREITGRNKILFIFFDERFTNNKKIPFSLSCKRKIPKKFKSNSLLEKDIDNLCSELILLDI